MYRMIYGSGNPWYVYSTIEEMEESLRAGGYRDVENWDEVNGLHGMDFLQAMGAEVEEWGCDNPAWREEFADGFAAACPETYDPDYDVLGTPWETPWEYADSDTAWRELYEKCQHDPRNCGRIWAEMCREEILAAVAAKEHEELKLWRLRIDIGWLPYESIADIEEVVRRNAEEPLGEAENLHGEEFLRAMGEEFEEWGYRNPEWREIFWRAFQSVLPGREAGRPWARGGQVWQDIYGQYICEPETCGRAWAEHIQEG